MPRLPTPGGDNGNWGEILNEYLSISHASDGTLEADIVGSAQIKNNAVGTVQLQDDSVGSAKLKDGAVTNVKLTDGSVTTAKLDDNSVTTTKLNDTSVTRAKLSDGLKDDLDSKLENITGHISSGTNITMTGLGTLASPYLISSSNSGGDVKGPASSTNNVVPRFDSTTGKLLKESSVTISDFGTLGAANLSATGQLVVATGGITSAQSLAQAGTTMITVGTQFVDTSAAKSSLANVRFSDSSNAAANIFAKSRGATVGTAGVVQTSDVLGNIGFNGDDGSGQFWEAARIRTVVDGTPATGSIPGRIEFLTTKVGGNAGEVAMVVNQNKYVGLGGTLQPTHTLTLAATSNGVSYYNTTDQTTNYERLRQYWNGNMYYMLSEAGGTGSVRTLVLGTTSRRINIVDGPGTAGNYQFSSGTSVAGAIGTVFSGTWGATNGINTVVSIAPSVTQSSTAGYTALLVNPTETSVGSGSKLLADFQVGGTSKTRIDNTGSHILSSGASLYAYNTTDETTNYERGTLSWSSNEFAVSSVAGGTGTQRKLALVGGSGGIDLRAGSATFGLSPIGLLTYTKATTSAQTLFTISGAQSQSSGLFTGLSLSPTITQTGTGGYTALLVNPTESTLGSGNRLLMDLQNGGSSKLSVTSVGRVTSNISTTSGTGFLVNASQTGANATDLADTAMRLNFTLGGTSTTDQLVTRVFHLNSTNGMTGGGTLTNHRILNISSTTVANSITDVTSNVFIESASSSAGTVNRAHGVHVASLYGTNQAGYSVAPLTTATNSALLLLGQTGVPTGNYAIYSASTNPSYFNASAYFNGSVGVLTSAPTHSLTLGSTATGLVTYNTSDQTTNYERARHYWASNTYFIQIENAGTGTARAMSINAAGGTTINLGGNGVAILRNSTAAGNLLQVTSTGLTGSSGTQIGVNIDPVISQSSTAGYTAIRVNISENATGSGAKLLTDLQVGGTSKFKVANDGLITASNRIAGVTDPTGAQDAATKNYVDTQVATATASTPYSSATWTGAVSLTPTSPTTYNISITGSTTLTLGTPAVTKSFMITCVITQDATGGRTLTTSGAKWSYGMSPTLSTAASATDVLHFMWTGTQWLGMLGGAAYA